MSKSKSPNLTRGVKGTTVDGNWRPRVKRVNVDRLYRSLKSWDVVSIQLLVWGNEPHSWCFTVENGVGRLEIVRSGSLGGTERRGNEDNQGDPTEGSTRTSVGSLRQIYRRLGEEDTGEVG